MDNTKEIRCLNRSLIAEKAFRAKAPTEYTVECVSTNSPSHKFNASLNPIFNVALDINPKLNSCFENSPEEVEKGYTNESINLFFHTTNSAYGRQAPKHHNAPSFFYPKDGKFTRTSAGHEKSAPLNTALDKTSY